MASYAANPRFAGLRARSLPSARVLGTVSFALLLLASVLLRSRYLHVHFWVDEGLSVGIASHGLADIPAVLRQDGSPPLYYALLHGWMVLFGRTESHTHALSLVLATLCVPAALWAGRSLFGTRAGWIAAGLAALSPFLTAYAQETRMYALVVLLSILCTAAFGHIFAFRRRRHLPLFSVTLALLLYTHNWTFFYGLASVIAVWLCWRAASDRRALLRDAAIGYGGALVLFAPWIPSVIFQARHTGAPWAAHPGYHSLRNAIEGLLGGEAASVLLLLVAGSGLAVLLRRTDARRTALASLLALALLTPLIAWIFSQLSPAWAARYLAVALGPFLLLAAAGLARARALELATLALLAVLWVSAPGPERKSNAHYVVASFAGPLLPGDWVVSTEPEQLPVVSYYLPPGLRFATVFGEARDPGVVDWRDGVPRLERTNVAADLEPILRGMPVGGHLLLVRPIFWDDGHWKAPWSRLVKTRTGEWVRALRRDKRFEPGYSVPGPLREEDPTSRDPGPNPLRGVLYTKVAN